jgi:hypothetical protein
MNLFTLVFFFSELWPEQEIRQNKLRVEGTAGEAEAQHETVHVQSWRLTPGY